MDGPQAGQSSTVTVQVQILLQRRGLKLNPVTTMYYIAPVSFLCLGIPWAFLEAGTLFADDKVSFRSERFQLLRFWLSARLMYLESTWMHLQRKSAGL